MNDTPTLLLVIVIGVLDCRGDAVGASPASCWAWSSGNGVNLLICPQGAPRGTTAPQPSPRKGRC